MQKIFQNIQRGVELLSHLYIFSTLLDFAELFSTLVLPVYTPTNSIIEFLLFSNFVNTSYC